jgi:hypothetical protein
MLPLSGRKSTYRSVQISKASSLEIADLGEAHENPSGYHLPAQAPFAGKITPLRLCVAKQTFGD